MATGPRRKGGPKRKVLNHTQGGNRWRGGLFSGIASRGSVDFYFHLSRRG
uniref:Uncharacterized protein n=1 Tax=Anopheles atroparvus TaxID=41427 RepID=A0AAG5D7D6_ANOAO